MPTPRPRLALALVLGVVLLAGAAAAVQLAFDSRADRSVYNLDIDAAAYDNAGWALAQTADLRAVPTSQPPGFIILLALIYGVCGHSYLAVKLTFCAMVVAAGGLAAYLAWTTLGALEGVATAALIVFSPLLVDYSATLQYEVPAAFLVVLLVVLLFVSSPRDDGRPRYVCAAGLGLTCAAAALVREVLVVLVPIAVLSLIIEHRRVGRQRQAFLAAALMGLTFALPIAAWSVIQFRHTGRWVLISDKSALNLRVGNNPAANGTYHLQLQPIGEPSGWPFIRDNPGHASHLAVRKILYFWGLARDPWTVPNHFAVVISRATGQVLPFTWSLTAARGGLMTGLFVVGAFILVRRPRLWVLPAMVLAIMGVHVVYFSSQRFAVPALGLISLCAALPLAGAIRWLASRGRIAAVPTAAALVWLLAAQMAWMPGRYATEAESLEGLSAENRADPMAHNGVARFGDRSAGARPIAFLAAETFPRGAFVLRVRARAETCHESSVPALTIAIRDDTRAEIVANTFTVDELCEAGGYATLPVRGVLRNDAILDVAISTTGATDVWIDDLEMRFGYHRRRDLP